MKSKERALLRRYKKTGLTPEEIERTLSNFSLFLMEVTGGKMSKTNYTLEAMVSVAVDHADDLCDECFFYKVANGKGDE